MLSDETKSLFAKIGMEYQPIAVKFCYTRPEGFERVDEVTAFCQFVKKAQLEDRAFYTSVEDDDCFGRMVLGMIDKPPFAASGQAGKDFGVFRTQAPNARLYTMIPTLTRGSVNYVCFAPVARCDFDPDLVICVANTAQADIIMRATSYISGDLWESKTSCVLSCAWTYAYPYVSGKVNTCISGMHHGMKRRHTYPEGLHIISIPYQKLDEVATALSEMDWELLAMREDEGGKAEMARRMDGWGRMQAQVAAEIGADAAGAAAVMPKSTRG